MDLKTINELTAITKTIIQEYVCDLEQRRADAITQDMHSYAADLKAAAREVEFVGYRLNTAFSAVAVDAIDSKYSALVNKLDSAIHNQPVELPEISAKHKTMDVSAE